MLTTRRMFLSLFPGIGLLSTYVDTKSTNVDTISSHVDTTSTHVDAKKYRNDKTFYHFQNELSDTWIIPHNLNAKFPLVYVERNDGIEVDEIIGGKIARIDTNNLTISFSSAFSGMAIIKG